MNKFLSCQVSLYIISCFQLQKLENQSDILVDHALMFQYHQYIIYKIQFFAVMPYLSVSYALIIDIIYRHENLKTL